MLEKIERSEQVKTLTHEQMTQLASDLRAEIVHAVMINGGHLSSNLGVVELTIALHYVFDFPKDRLIFDVGHQCYAHKMLTGRRSGFARLRSDGGVAGFPKRSESRYDAFDSGHASNSLSVGCGMARADRESDRQIISLLGDGAMTGGLVFEALNDIRTNHNKQILILNDNDMSISKNVGYVSEILSLIRKRNGISFVPSELTNIDYIGVIDGHDLNALIDALRRAKESPRSVFVHVVTEKGKGYALAESDPAKYHGYSCHSDGNVGFSSVVGNKLTQLALQDERIFAVTAAMEDGTGLEPFKKAVPERFVDVAIAEGHAMTMCAGLAAEGKKPYFAVYSTFLQRAFDNLLHDVCLGDYPVTVCLDRSGIVAGDGSTHQGIYDVAFTRALPNLTIACPKDASETERMLEWSVTYDHPLIIRYPKSTAGTSYATHTQIALGKWEKLIDEGNDLVLLASGAAMVEQAMSAARILREADIRVDVINARFVRPLDIELLDEISRCTIVTLEDNVKTGGFGSAVCEYYNEREIRADLHIKALTEDIQPHGSTEYLFARNGLDAEGIARYCAELNARED